jgi:predicted nuclease with TOPRIM domain
MAYAAAHPEDESQGRTIVQEVMAQRLGELRAEYRAGQKMLAELEAEQANLQQTLLRVSGAIQVLEELLDAPPEAGAAKEGPE